MTRDEVRKLADLAGWTPTALAMATEAEWARLEAFAGLIHGYVVHEEREACAKVCEDYGTSNTTKACAQAIRARSAA
jgi:hypothetical protein